MRDFIIFYTGAGLQVTINYNKRDYLLVNSKVNINLGYKYQIIAITLAISQLKSRKPQVNKNTKQNKAQTQPNCRLSR